MLYSAHVLVLLRCEGFHESRGFFLNFIYWKQGISPQFFSHKQKTVSLSLSHFHHRDKEPVAFSKANAEMTDQMHLCTLPLVLSASFVSTRCLLGSILSETICFCSMPHFHSVASTIWKEKQLTFVIKNVSSQWCCLTECFHFVSLFQVSHNSRF